MKTGVRSESAMEESDETAIRDVFANIGKLIRSYDLDGLMDFYSSDVVVFDVVPPRQQVGEEFRSLISKALRTFDKSFTIDVEDLAIVVRGGLAYARSIHHIKAAAESGAEWDWTCRVTHVLQKDAGRWRILHEHSSVPVDLFGSGMADLQA
jgi:uncharacterized protein (TIGR02246 family)